MWRLKMLLLPAAAFAELLVLAACWVLAVCRATKAAGDMHDWATSTLPDLEWYITE